MTLIRWSGTISHHNVTLTDLCSNSRLPQALNQHVVCCIQELHTSKLLLNIKGNLSSTYSLPALPEEPVSKHRSTHAKQAVPPHLSYCSINNVTIQHLRVELQFLLLVSKAACICVYFRRAFFCPVFFFLEHLLFLSPCTLCSPPLSTASILNWVVISLHHWA